MTHLRNLTTLSVQYEFAETSESSCRELCDVVAPCYVEERRLDCHAGTIKTCLGSIKQHSVKIAWTVEVDETLFLN